MEADPRLLKADIAPLLDHITPEVINSTLLELHKIGLIILYSTKDRSKKYLQIMKFEENQKNLRKDREAPSRIPEPSADLLRSESGPTPDELPLKLREEKLREANARAREDDPPVDNSKNAPLEKEPEPEEPDALMTELREITEDIGNKTRNQYKMREVMLFIEANIKKKNHAAMMHCLKSLQKQLQNGERIEAPRKYLEAALKIEDGKHNAREHEERAKSFKGPPTRDGMMAIGRVFEMAAKGGGK